MASEEEKMTDMTAHFFLSNLSHEIRTPLNGIVGYTQLLLETKLDSTQKMYTTSMNKCCIQLMSLINDILDFSKLATGKMRINNECFSMEEVINEVTSTLNLRITAKNQKCRFIIGNIPKYIISDKNKIIQILINLVSNANKFTPNGGRIIVNMTEEKENTIQISVEDNGIGITEEEQKKLFNAFYQVQNSVNKSGSGLGLAISKKLVELLNGTIAVESAKDQGSKFIFTFLYEPFEIFQKQVEKRSKILKNKNILIVDDDVDSRLEINEILLNCNVNPIPCSSLKEALQLIKGKRYHFAVAIINSSMGDGTIAQKIRETENELPLIGLTQENVQEVTDILYNLTKPIHKVKLLDTLIKVLKKSDIEECILSEQEKNSELSENTENVETDTWDMQKPKILVVDDTSYNLIMLEKMLEQIGYKNIDTSADGREAIQKISEKIEKKEMYDIILLDLKMPDIDGFGVLDFMIKDPKNLSKVVILTASILDSDKERCKKMGVKYFLVKPVDMGQLKIILRKCL